MTTTKAQIDALRELYGEPGPGGEVRRPGQREIDSFKRGNTMTDKTENLPVPVDNLPATPGICVECRRAMIGHKESGALWGWCDHVIPGGVGAFWKPKDGPGRWRLDTPITETDFLAAILAGLEKAEQLNSNLIDRVDLN